MLQDTNRTYVELPKYVQLYINIWVSGIQANLHSLFHEQDKPSASGRYTRRINTASAFRQQTKIHRLHLIIMTANFQKLHILLLFTIFA